MTDALSRDGFSVAAALETMSKAVKGTPAVLSDVYSMTTGTTTITRNDSETGGSRKTSALESTTVDVWLIPRIVAAAAALHARRCNLPNVASASGLLQLCKELSNLAVDVLDVGLKATGGIERIRAVIVECLCAVYRAFARSGRPAFPPQLAPSLKLMAHLGSELDAPRQQVRDSIFAFFTTQSSTTALVGAAATALEKRAKYTASREEGISRLWFAEDHASFSPNLGKKLSEEHRVVLCHSLLLVTVDMTLRLASLHPDKLADLAAAAGKTLLGEWMVTTAISEYSPLKGSAAQVTSLDATRLHIASSALVRDDGSLPKAVQRRIAIFIIRHYGSTIRGTISRSASEVNDGPSLIKVLQGAVQLCGKSEVADDASAALFMLSQSIVAELTAKAVPPMSGLQADAAAKAEQDEEMQLKMLALDGLIVLLQSDLDARALGIQNLPALIADLLMVDGEEGEEKDEYDARMSDFVSSAQRLQLLEISSRITKGRVRKQSDENIQWEEVERDIQRENEPVKEWTNPYERQSNEAAGGDDGFAQALAEGIRLAARRFCFEARTLIRTDASISCRLCDSSLAPLSHNEEEGKVIDAGRLSRMRARILLSSCASTWSHTRGPSVVASVNFVNSLCKHAVSEPILQIVGLATFTNLLRSGMSHRERNVRLASGRLGAQIVQQISQGGPSRRASLSQLFQIYLDVLNHPKRGRAETTILSMGLLGSIDDDKVREFVLLNLVLQLGKDPFSKSLAYTIITQLAAQNRCTNFQLLAPYLETISVQVVVKMTSAPTLFLEVLALTNQNQGKFLRSTLPYTLPHVLDLEETKSDKTLKLIAGAIGQNVRAMCFEQAAAVLRHFLMLPSPRREEGMNKLVAKVRGDDERDDINLSGMLKSFSVELFGPLVTCLGDPTLREGAVAGLRYYNDIVHNAEVTAHADKKDLSTFLKDEILAILAWINDDLNGGHGRKSLAHKAMATRSVGALIKVVGQTISMVMSQIMATLNSTIQKPDLVLPALESWHTFITHMRYDDVAPFIGQTAATFLAAWFRFGAAEKNLAASILRYIVIDGKNDFRQQLQQGFPSLEEIKTDVPDICKQLRDIGILASRQPEVRIQHILQRAVNVNASICGQALQELKAFLAKERDFVERITSGHLFGPIVSNIVHVLFTTATRADEQEQIRDACFESLGMLGAVDPDRLKLESTSRVVVIDDFENKDDVIDFALHLIKDVLIGAFRATNDTKHQAALAYALQELLKFCGFTPALLPNSTQYRQVPLKTRHRFASLTPDMLDTIAPLLSSKYSVQHGDSSKRERPFYKHTSSFREWIQVWTNDLILNSQGTDAHIIFDVFRSAIRDHDLSIANHILPHLILNILILGEDEQLLGIYEEFKVILSDQIDPKTTFSPDRRMKSAQTVFGLLDHISAWLNRRMQALRKAKNDANKGQARRRAGGDERVVVRANELSKGISQELMAQAALQCRAYARSLLNFEQRIRSLRDEGAKDQDLQAHYEAMHTIYANLDEPDGMEGISTKVISPSLEHQIREHESTGRWTAAQSCWEVRLQQRPDSSDLHTGLLRCLRSLGHYDTMRTHIRGVLSVHPDWDELLAPFYVEGSCILSDWAEVGKVLARGTGDQSPEHATARVMLAMHHNDQATFAQAMRDARRLLGKPIVAAGKDSYVTVYDSVAQLHMLHELSIIHDACGSTTADGGATVSRTRLSQSRLSETLAARLNATLPSFRTREPLLSLRRSAFSAHGQFRAETGQSWIASSKIARRAGHTQTAYSAALQATQWEAPFAFVQQAKLMALGDQPQAAIQELSNALSNFVVQDGHIKKVNEAVIVDLDSSQSIDESSTVLSHHAYANAYLLRARLAEATGRLSPNEIIEQYKQCAKLDDKSEKMFYYLGRYYDQDREQTSNLIVQQYNVCRYFFKSAQFGTKFFYRTLPRICTIWFDCGDEDDLVALSRGNAASKVDPKTDPDRFEAFDYFRKLNDTIKRYIRKLTPYQWLAVFPQLYSRVVHKNDIVWKVLQELIAFVLEQYPHQAMWALVAGCQSKDPDRLKRVRDIVKQVKAKAAKEKVRTIERTQKMAEELLKLCEYPVGKEIKTLSMQQNFPRLAALATNELIIPLQDSISVSLPADNLANPQHLPFDTDLPRISGKLLPPFYGFTMYADRRPISI